MTAISDLLERVEKATGPDREIDCLLWAYLVENGRTVTYLENNLVVSDKPGDVQIILGWIDPGKTERNFSTSRVEPKEYTASIDAALALVERKLPGAEWSRDMDQVNDDGTEEITIAWRESETADWVIEDGRARSTPLAILAALLKALETP